jgi:two-component system, OmpR family, response regulator PhoP
MMDRLANTAYANEAPLRIAVLEDDENFRQTTLLPALRDGGFCPRGVSSATELYRTMLSHRFDIVLLNAGLPDEDGFTVAAHLRSMSAIGIVMLMDQSTQADHIRALKSGADAFLTQPVNLDLLGATLTNVGRRLTQQHVVRESAANSTDIISGKWSLEGGGSRLVSPSGDVVPLTAAERCVTMILAAEDGRPVAREWIIHALAHNVYDFDPHRLEMTIHRLRRKVLMQTGDTLPLLTVRGRGYMFACEPLPHSDRQSS